MGCFKKSSFLRGAFFFFSISRTFISLITSNHHMFIRDICWARVLTRRILAARKWEKWFTTLLHISSRNIFRFLYGEKQKKIGKRNSFNGNNALAKC
jgi:hypothetical protein